MNRLNLLVLRCRDIEKSRAFYELLGMKFVRHAHGKGPQHFSHEDERGVFELYPANGEKDDKTGLGFGCADLNALMQTFASYKPDAVRETEWGRSFIVRDPDGRRVEIKEIAV